MILAKCAGPWNDVGEFVQMQTRLLVGMSAVIFGILLQKGLISAVALMDSSPYYEIYNYQRLIAAFQPVLISSHQNFVCDPVLVQNLPEI